MKTGASILGVLLGSTVLSPLPALAAEISESAPIIVTAQKREENAQEIPVSLSVLTSETVERQGITSIQELGNSVAGVSISGINPGAMQLTIRGTTDISSSNQSSQVNGLYVDETVMSYVPGYMPEVSLLDIERVEILRGPQGTLFGEGSEGGTIRVITRKPDSSKFFGKAKLGAYATAHGGQGYAAQGSVNIPLVRDVLAVSVMGSYRNLPGWLDIPDISTKDSNTSKLVDSRVAVRFTPNDRLTIDAVYQMGRSKIRDFISTSREEMNPRKSAAAVGLTLGPVAGLSPSEGHLDIASFTASYDLGGATLVSASSYTNATFDSIRDLSAVYPATPFPPAWLPKATAQSAFQVGSKAFTQEVRLVSDQSNALKWTVGGFYKHEKRAVEDGFNFSLPAISYSESPRSHSDQKGNSWAAFADLDYDLTDALSVQAGLRYFHDKKSFRVEQLAGSNFPLGFAPKGAVESGNNGAHATSPKLGLTYKLSQKALVFVKYSEGFRGGGANTVPVKTYPSATSEYGPDALRAFEVGLKSELPNGWTLNVYAFRNNQKSLQMPFCTTEGNFYCVYTYVRNAGDAKANGVELELSGQVSSALNFAVTYAYNDAKITGNIDNNASGVKVGNLLPLNSKHKATLALHYEKEVASGLTWSLDERYRWASKTYSDPANTASYVNQPTSQLYLGTSLAGAWGTLTLFADNVFDRADTVARFPAKVPVFSYANYLRPRNFGLEFKKAF